MMATVPTTAEIIYQKNHISDTQVPNIIATNAICFPIACAAIVLRFTSRRLSKIKYEADDWLIVAGLLFTFGVLLCDCIGELYISGSLCIISDFVSQGLRFGAGRHSILLSDAPLFAQVSSFGLLSKRQRVTSDMISLASYLSRGHLQFRHVLNQSLDLVSVQASVFRQPCLHPHPLGRGHLCGMLQYHSSFRCYISMVSMTQGQSLPASKLSIKSTITVAFSKFLCDTEQKEIETLTYRSQHAHRLKLETNG